MIQQQGNEFDLGKTLIYCLQNVTTSSVNKRNGIVRQLLQCIECQGFQDGHLKGVAKIICFTVTRYKDKSSRRLVLNFLDKMLLVHGLNAIKCLLTEMHILANRMLKQDSSLDSASSALVLLSWCSKITKVCVPENAVVKILSEVEVICYSIVCACHSNRMKRMQRCAYHYLETGKTVPLLLQYLDIIINNDKYQLESLCYFGFVFQYLTMKKEIDKIDQTKKKALIDVVVKNCIQTKVKANYHYLEYASPFLKYVTHEEFKEILPTIEKGLLRNPETIMQAVAYLLSGLSIDLSIYVVELSKCIAVHLISKNTLLQADAIFTVSVIAKQCSDAAAVECLLKFLLNVLNGSEGKLVLPEQRNAVLQAIESVSSTTVSGSEHMESLATTVHNALFSFILQEGHEATLIQSLNVMRIWSRYFINNLPKNFIDNIKKGVALKISTSLVQAYYFLVAGEAIKGNTISQASGLIETLLQAVDKVKGQTHLVNNVFQCITASTLVMRLLLSDDIQVSGSKTEAFWNLILDPIKKPLISEKFLAALQPEYLVHLGHCMNTLFLNYASKLTTKILSPWYHAFNILLVHGNWKTRKAVKTLLGRIFDGGNFDTREFQCRLFDDLNDMVEQSSTKERKEDEAETIAFPVDNVLDAFSFLCTHGNDEELLYQALKECMVYVHHPVLYKTAPLLFNKIATKRNSDGGRLFIEKYKDELLDYIVSLPSLTQANENLLRTLLSLHPDAMLMILINQVKACLSNPDVSNVTYDEYQIMNTPDGEAYDQSVFNSAKAVSQKSGNVKRESKAYSYKEQKAEMELRAEIEKKKGQTEKKIELNKKQKEQLHAILTQEKVTRERLKSLEQGVIKHARILSLILNTGHETLLFYVQEFISMTISLFGSRIAAPYIVPVYINISKKLFKGELEHLGELIANVVLRLKKPVCDLPPGWSDEKLSEQLKRALNTLRVFVTERNVYTMMTYTRKKPFSAPTFGYCLPLLKAILKDQDGLIKGHEELRLTALQLIQVHSRLRSQAVELDENGPELLPRKEILKILSDVIVACEGNNKEARLQQQANNVFDEVCKSASGQPGCAFASVDEIEILLSNILSQCSVLRNASLKGIIEFIDVLPHDNEVIMTQLTKRILIGRFDMIEDNAKLAKNVWEKADLKIHPTMIHDLVNDVSHPLEDVRLAVSLALGVSLEENKSIDVVAKLLEIYNERLKIPPPIIDNLGRVVSTPFIDPWEARQGVGLALEKIALHVTAEKLGDLFNFFVPGALGDRSEAVRKQMLEASLQYVNLHGQDNMNLLLGIFQDFLDSAPDSSEQDTIRQSVIILTGSIAKHFDKTDPQIKPIFAKLMAALSTPSQSVQQAVANCLPPLCGAMKDEAPALVKKLLNQLLESESYGERRGAAFGLAGLVKGLGILSLKQHSIITTLNDAIQNKKIWRHREGALFAFETLCTMLGRLFEPYVVHLLPHLLLCFGDGNQYVREAADETAKAVMKNLSNHGVKLVLPSLLKALEEEAWRTKTGSVELLGAMSFCAPKQLSSCLPSIVPRLTEVLADSHLKVQKAGQQALRQIGGVIRNPEIQEISPIILDALSDPNKHTVACLQALLSTSFIHVIDAPSLALIMPTLEKALGQRPTETKKMAAQILGNMYALTDPKDLSPYLPAIVPGLKKSLLDPSPEVRAVSSRALGAIVKGMGEDCYNDLMPWLLETLTSEVSSVDRSGAAQGLSEVLFALGTEKLDKLMPDVIATTVKTELPPSVRDGYLMLYIYLPATFEDEFLDYIGPIIPAILKGLADESEYVRDTSLKAGQRIINMYADSAIELLLPQLEAGLFDEHWRIRLSSVQLLGDLLFKLSGVTGKQSTVSEEDDNFGTAHSAQVILETLGQERRDHVYAGLYMGRSDVALAVRQAALHVWKVIVQNTAKTLREILPVLFELLLGCLASQFYDKRQVAARTLGDLVRKLGERILPEIIPILETGLDNEDADKRQGVCIGLSEIMDSTSREMIGQFEDSLINTIRKALVDESPEVRHAASLSFENLHNTIGHRALDGVLPEVFKKLDNPELSDYALDGLKQVMAVKSKSVLPFLVPKLTTPPVNTKALAILSSVAGEALIKHIEKILPAMIQAVQTASNSGEDGNSEFEGTRTLIVSVEDETGIRTIVDELIAASKNQNPGIRKVASNLLTVFCKETRGDYTPYIQSLFRTIIQLMNDVDSDVVLCAWSALDALVKRLDPSEQLQHLSSLRQAVRYIKDDIRNDQLPGFCILKKGITPVLPIFREGILNGPQEIKEQAANGLGEIIKLTSAEALRPSVVHITGPLIRILGDRFNSSVKVAILDTLGLLLKKVGILLKPFLPQLQTTFIKSLNDASLGVRQKAAWALGLLTVLHTRVDSLFTELKNGIKNNEDNAIRETILGALRTITLKAGNNMGDTIRSALLETLEELISSTDDAIRVKAAAALGALCQVLPKDDIRNLLINRLLEINQMLDWTICHGRSVTLSYALYDAPSHLFDTVDEDDIVEAAVKYSNYDRVPICMYGVHSLGHLLMFSKENKDAAPPIVVSSMKKNMTNTSVDVRLASLNTLKHISKQSPHVLTFDRIRYLIPEFISLLRDRNTAVRASAELTLAFVLQLDKNDILFDECVNTIPEASNFLEEYRKNSFNKLSDSLATDKDDYLFVT